MSFCLAIAATFWGDEVEMTRSVVGIKSWSRRYWRTRDPRLPDVPVRRTFMVVCSSTKVWKVMSVVYAYVEY